MAMPNRVNVDKALKARIKGQSLSEIAAVQGVSKQAIDQAIKPILQGLANPDTVAFYRKEQANIMDGLAARTVASIVDEDFEKATLQQKIVGIGILTDKSRLIRGESTSNISMISKMLHDCPDLPCQVINSGDAEDV